MSSDTARPSEQGHWYDRAGNSRYTVIGANGKERPTTLRDARQLDLVPSVTSIIRLAAAPGLEAWKREQVLLAALTLPRRPHEPEASWIARVWQDSREQAARAAERGTAIHASVQGHYEGVPPIEEHWPHVKAAADELARVFPAARWVAERAFCHPAGYGGKCDLHTVHDRGVVIDIKTKEFADPDKIVAYDEHAMQLAAYRRGLGLPMARCGNLFVSVSVPGLVRLVMLDEEVLVRGERMFDALLAFWQCKSKREQLETV